MYRSTDFTKKVGSLLKKCIPDIKKKNKIKPILANFHFKYNPWLYVLDNSVSVQRNP